MQQQANAFSIKGMCRALEVSRSGFYAWRQRLSHPSPRAQRRMTLDAQVASAFTTNKGRAGSPRIRAELAAQGQTYNRKTIAESLRRQQLRAKAARCFKATTNSNHNLPVAENLLQRDFSASTPNQKWVGDITYLATDEGWLYLAVIIDLYSRMVVGWAMSERMTADIVCDALQMALWRRGKPKGVLIHSDRGAQYCSNAYQALIAQHDLRCSMSRKGNCWDNACAESFFHSLKIELIYGQRYTTRERTRQEVFEYIEVDYNRTRRHSANGYLSPEVYEAQQVA